MKNVYLGRNKKFLGVCAGVANYFSIDPTIIRILVAAIAIYTAIIPTLIVYIGLSFVFSQPPEDYVEPNPAKRLCKSESKKLSGVCGGIADYFGIDATLIRLAFLVLVLFVGCGLAAYIICACLMPEYQPLNDNYNN